MVSKVFHLIRYLFPTNDFKTDFISISKHADQNIKIDRDIKITWYLILIFIKLRLGFVLSFFARFK